VRYYIQFLVALIFFQYFISCNTKENQKVKLEVVVEEKLTAEKQSVVDFIEGYINSVFDSTSLQERNNQWESSLLYYMQDRFLFQGQSKESFLNNPPKVLGVRKDSLGSYFVNILFSRGEVPIKIMEMKLQKDPHNRFYFIDRFSENIKRYNLFERDGYQFYYSPTCVRDTIAETKAIEYNQRLSDYFERPLKRFRVVVCSNIDEYNVLHSLKYTDGQNLDYQGGGLAVPDEDLYFSMDSSPYYPHEMVHLYTSHFEDFYWFDEGLATYLGGSVGYDLDYHLQKIADSLDQFDFSDIPQNDRVDEMTTYKYAIGGLFIKLANEEYGGKETIFKLMNYGKKKEDFFAALKEVFGVEKEELDVFIKAKIKEHYSK
tara:strand:- start:13136 stop:14254 length:1119 start_codon:yes stop_codon:yes gene_type:complete